MDRYHRIPIIILISLVLPVSVGAQSIRFHFTNGSELDYPITEVRSITLPDGGMVVALQDGNSVGWELSALSRVEHVGLTTVVPTTGAEEDMRMLVFPNPTSGDVHLRFVLEQASAVVVEVRDLQGKRVRQLLRADLSQGQHQLQWDGRDANGTAVASGAYFISIQAQGRRTSRLLLIQQ